MSKAAAGMVDDDLWSAIGDPTRRRMLDLLLVEGDGTATTLGNQLPVTRQAVAKQLGALADAGLLHAERVGRETRYTVTPQPLGDAAAWLVEMGGRWDERLAALGRSLARARAVR